MAFNGTVSWAGTVRAVRMCAAASALPLVTVPAHATEVDDQAWFTLSGAQDFGKAAVQLDLSTRLTDELTRMSQQNARLTATYDLSPKVSVGGGYYYGQSEQPDVPDIVEHRPFEQVNVRIGGLPKGVTLVSRSRLEERFRQGGPGMGLRSYENRLATESRLSIRRKWRGISTTRSGASIMASAACAARSRSISRLPANGRSSLAMPPNILRGIVPNTGFTTRSCSISSIAADPRGKFG